MCCTTLSYEIIIIKYLIINRLLLIFLVNTLLYRIYTIVLILMIVKVLKQFYSMLLIDRKLKIYGRYQDHIIKNFLEF